MNEIAHTPIVSMLRSLENSSGLKSTDLANITNVSKATVSRWRNGRKIPHPSTQLVISDLIYTVNRLSEYYTTQEIRTWLYARHPQLNGSRPIDLISTNRTQEVLVVLDRLDADAYI